MPRLLISLLETLSLDLDLMLDSGSVLMEMWVALEQVPLQEALVDLS